MSAKEKEKEFHLPKNYTEFYPKNYTKKNKASNEEYIPSKQKESKPFYYSKYPKLKNKFNKYTTPSQKKIELEHEEDYSEDDYSVLASKNYNKKEKINPVKKNNNLRYSEDDFKTKWKTEMCHYWEMYGKCKYGNTCAFAHGIDELNKRKMSSNYKTKPCKQFFEIGYCTYGIRCQFSHKLSKEIEEENKISYMKILKEFNDQNNIISHEIIKRPRLNTFEDITKSGIETKEKNRLALYEDILEIKKKENDDKVFSEETSDGNSINNELNNLLNEDEENFDFNIDDYAYNDNEEKKENVISL